MTAVPAKAVSVGMIATNFSARLDEAGVALWLAMLDGYDDDAVHKAAVRLIRTCSQAQYGRMPAFALMQAELDAVTGSASGADAIRLQAQAEWDRLIDSVATFGRYREPAFHPTTAIVVRRMGGWDTVCSWPTASYDFKRRDFVSEWTDVHGREPALALGADAVADRPPEPQGSFPVKRDLPFVATKDLPYAKGVRVPQARR